MPSKNSKSNKRVAPPAVPVRATKVAAVATAAGGGGASVPKPVAVAPPKVLTAAEILQAHCAPGTDYWRMDQGLVSWADAMEEDENKRKAIDPVYAAEKAAEEAAWHEAYRKHWAEADQRAAEAKAAKAAEDAAVSDARISLRNATYGEVSKFLAAQVEDSRLWYVATAEIQNRNWAFEDMERLHHVCTCPNPDGPDAEWDPPMGWECECFKPLHRDAEGNVEECRFFNSPMGCREGTACPYTHVKRDISEIPCRFETSGVGCRPMRGKTCPYKHAPRAAPAPVVPAWRSDAGSDAASVASAGSDGWRPAGAGWRAAGGGGRAADAASVASADSDGWHVAGARAQRFGGLPRAPPAAGGGGGGWRGGQPRK